MKRMDSHLDSVAVAERYKISRRSIANWMKNERMGFPKPFLRINRRFYWKLSDLLEWERARGADHSTKPETALGLPVVSDVIQDYSDFVKAMARRRTDIKLSCLESDAIGGMQEGYTNKLENWRQSYGRGMGPEVFPLWLGSMRVGIVLVDLPRRPRQSKRMAAAQTQ